ncbi:MAG: hypothetical protein DYG83_08975 [Candidatus Brocadia sp. AMX2]|uniref:hypothetical protein n=1 Tax=Candidatus Brocadia TaxID=380240 RepID=UPI0006961387|nr:MULTISPECIES: hypothetical protein [Brocadia]MBC6933460.1 hypothetical protein [Candidatus Brocadia sp.]MBL1168031.1 hypothetical protein [Candidatus Brocadia sp. AMX1]MCK6469248.1 hypothetical protein [Candidatus Brocadia sinica]NOG42609.1 hypothetical protein [Planctomycetota bacterium]KAA0243058.1 MAG: hypothetical protein EDM70_12115 [Candidatus Brocadia sp. AMX2]
MGKYTGKIFVLCRGSIIVFYLLPVWVYGYYLFAASAGGGLSESESTCRLNNVGGFGAKRQAP